MKFIAHLLTQFVFVMIGGNMASVGYVIAIFFSVLGGILIANVEKTTYLIVAICLALLGLVVMFFRIRADIVDIRKELKKDKMGEYLVLFKERLSEAKYFLKESERLDSKELKAAANEAVGMCEEAIKNSAPEDAEAYHNDLMSALWECSEIREEVEE